MSNQNRGKSRRSVQRNWLNWLAWGLIVLGALACAGLWATALGGQ